MTLKSIPPVKMTFTTDLNVFVFNIPPLPFKGFNMFQNDLDFDFTTQTHTRLQHLQLGGFAHGGRGADKIR